MRTTLLLAVALTACGGDDTDTGSGTDTPVTTTAPDPSTVPLAGRCDLADAYGAFVLDSYVDYATFAGKIADGVLPVTILENVGSSGDCTLLRRNNPYCDPACSPDETCDPVLGCVPYPAGQDAGHVRVTGLATEVEIDPVVPGYSYFFTDLPVPPYTPGDLVGVHAAGATVATFDLYGVAPEALTIPADDLVLDRAADLIVKWTPPELPSRSTVYFRLTVDQHGLTPIQLTCETADDGELTVDAALVTQLLDAGVTGFPNGDVIRQTVDSTTVLDGGCIQFEINSPQEPHVVVAGVTNCQSDAECPTGQHCNLATEICE